MSAALERRLQALESKASEQVRRIIWVSWLPTNPDDEVATAQHGGTEWQRQQGEDLFSFRQRVERAVAHQPGSTFIWAMHHRRSTCHH